MWSAATSRARVPSMISASNSSKQMGPAGMENIDSSQAKRRAFGENTKNYRMEAIMPEQSSVHLYLNWAKERIDEMDAALASFEVKASQAQAESKVRADQLVNDLKK